MSELDVPLLVRRARLLLRFYPRAYRAHRGEEILGTLLDTTRPGRGWPPAYEVASVIGGGLRARRAANLDQGLRASLRHVGILAAAMILAGTPTMLLWILGQEVVAPPSPRSLSDMVPGLALGSLLVLTALAAAWCGRRWLAVAAAVAATAVDVVYWQTYLGASGAITEGAPSVLALVALLSLIKRSERPPPSLLWLPCLLPAVTFVETFAVASGLFSYDALPVAMTPRMQFFLSPYDTYLSLVPVLVAVCWLVTDVRPLAALALQALLTRALYIAFDPYTGETWTQMMIAAGLVLLALTAALVWLLRRRARTAPPTIG